MHSPSFDPVVHLELHTGNLARASDFCTRVFGWSAETVDVGHCTYLSLKLGDRIDGGIVEHDGEGSLWLPYVEVTDLVEVIERARALGAQWRSSRAKARSAGAASSPSPPAPGSRSGNRRTKRGDASPEAPRSTYPAAQKWCALGGEVVTSYGCWSTLAASIDAPYRRLVPLTFEAEQPPRRTR